MIEFNFPLLSTEEQQSIFGAYGESYSLQGPDYGDGNWGPDYGDYDGPFYGDNGGDGNWGPDYNRSSGSTVGDISGQWELDEEGTPIFISNNN